MSERPFSPLDGAAMRRARCAARDWTACGWTLKTASLVNKISLADGLGGVNYNATITRDQVAKFGFNTLKATEVYYIFSKSAFTSGLQEKQKQGEVTLVTLEEIYKKR